MSFEQRVAYMNLMQYVEEIINGPASSTLLKILDIKEHDVRCYGGPMNMVAFWNLVKVSGKFDSDVVRPMRDALESLGDEFVSKDDLKKFADYDEKYLGKRQ